MLLTLPLQGAYAEDNIGTLIDSLKSKDVETQDTQTTRSLNPVKVEDVYSALSKPVERQPYRGKKISLDLQDADVVNVLRLLADVGRVNIVFGSDVSGKVTVNLKNIPWDQALDIVLMTNGLDKVRLGNIIRVAKSETITEEANKRLAAMKASDKVEPLLTRIVPVNYSNIGAIKDSELIKNILSDRGKIDIDERTNTLVIHDIRKSVDQIETLVKRLDTRIPQVLIEARIVEAADQFASEFGIQWGFYRTAQSDHWDNTIFSATPAHQSFFGLNDPRTGNPIMEGGESAFPGYGVNLPATDVLDVPGKFGFNIAKFTSNSITALDLQLSAAESTGIAKVISSPRVMTVDNREANIVQGEDIPYLSVSQDGTQVQFVEANLELIVTPHVTAENTILLKLETHRDSPNFENAVQGQPAITRNTAETELLLDDGETTVIGGIYVVENSNVREGIPFLMNLPYLGWLFSYEKNIVQKKELLVFITPKIIR
jgi:type IV pilus assembly protein PilQ